MFAQMTSSRKEARLLTEINSCRTVLSADCKRAELAACLARLGNFDAARKLLNELRSRNDNRPAIGLSIRIHLAEGLLAYFSNLGMSKADGVQRAYALSVAAGLNDLTALCASWLAQWAYVDLDMDRLARFAGEALRFSSLENHAARSRAALVMAQALHLAARPDLAQVWYSRCRQHANEDADEVTISALMHNMAWLRMLSRRQVILTGRGSEDAGQYALASAESIEHFDQMHGGSSWNELKPILRAQIASLENKYEQALSLYIEHLDGAKAATRLQANLLADKAWCHVGAGQLEEARSNAVAAVSKLNDEIQTDDLAAAHSRLAQVFSMLNDANSASYHASLADKVWSKHFAMQHRAIELLATMSDRGTLTNLGML